MARHIAIIEDEQAIADNYRDALQRQGYRVSHYLDRVSALSACQLALPDLAIIDVAWETMWKAVSSCAASCAA